MLNSIKVTTEKLTCNHSTEEAAKNHALNVLSKSCKDGEYGYEGKQSWFKCRKV